MVSEAPESQPPVPATRLLHRRDALNYLLFRVSEADAGAVHTPSPPVHLEQEYDGEGLPLYPGTDNGLQEKEPESLLKITRRRALKTIGVLTLWLTSRYLQDYNRGKLDEATAEPSLSRALDAEPTAPTDTMIADYDGLSGRDAANAAKAEVSYKKLGDVDAVRYGKDVAPKPIAKKIIERAKVLGKKKVIMSGRSMGGIVAVETAIEVLENSDLEVPFVVLDCSPSSIDSVRPEKLTALDYITWVLSHVKGIEYSRDANFFAQYVGHILKNPLEIFRQNIFQNILTAANVFYEANGPSKASIRLMQLEYNAIVAANMGASLDALGKLPTKRKPILVLFQPSDLSADETINSEKSAAEWKEYAKNAGLTLLLIRAPGITHANPGFKPGAWNRGMEVQVFPAINDLERTAAARAEAEAKAAELAAALSSGSPATVTTDGQAAAPGQADTSAAQNPTNLPR